MDDPQSHCLIDPLSCWALSYPLPDVGAAWHGSCHYPFLWMCLVVPPEQSGGIFGFTEFVTAFALLVLIYTMSEVQYRFRVATAPLPLWRITYWLSAFIGLGTLTTDLWFAERFPIPSFLASRHLWQAGFGLLFFAQVMIWLWYAFVQPPVFSRRNSLRYIRVLYHFVLQGSDRDIPVIASEIVRSAKSVIKHATLIPYIEHQEPRQKRLSRAMVTAQCANEILLLIANRKFCRHVIASSPITAMAFFDAMTEQEKYRISIGQFAANLSMEALINKDSMLYHEDEGYYSGLIGYVKPFSNALYGNFDLVEALGSINNSPLDINYQSRSLWDAGQTEAYGRAILITFTSYLEGDNWGTHSYALYRAFHDIQGACSDVYKLDGVETGFYSTDIYQRLSTVVDFIKRAVDLLEKHKEKVHTKRRRNEAKQPYESDLSDVLAQMMVEIIFNASTVSSPVDTCWTIHHNTVWSSFFRSRNGEMYKLLEFKLRRLLYNEIALERMNYKSARILGLCLNAMGLQLGKKTGYGSEQYALRKVVLAWTKKNFLTFYAHLPDVAEAAIMGSITFDKENNRLVKTYLKGPSREAPKEFLDLDPPSALKNQ